MERALRFDSAAISNATSQETQVMDILGNLRAREAKEVWGSDIEMLKYPRVEFLVAKETIEISSPYQMLKAALLHGHRMQCVMHHSFINLRLTTPTRTFVCQPTYLPAPYSEALAPEISVLHEHPPSLTSPYYKPSAWASLTMAWQEFSLGGPLGV
ncbi:hypothetical protein FRC06_009592 [Ceratobasidium sp. 370]|nr:hypothetical protein FRC06_009592 [Ceratobasidium sp. 370]